MESVLSLFLAETGDQDNECRLFCCILLVAKSPSLRNCNGICLSDTLIDCQGKGIVLCVLAIAWINLHTYAEKVVLMGTYLSLEDSLFANKLSFSLLLFFSILWLQR